MASLRKMLLGRHAQAFAWGAEAALAALLCVLPMSLGSAPSWVLWPLVGLSTLAAALLWTSRWLRREALAWPAFAWVPLLGAVLCLVQLFALPASLLKVLSPAAEELRAYTLSPFGVQGGGPLSLDPPATWRELAKHVSYALVIFVAADLARARHRRRRILGALVLSGGLIAAVGLVHSALGLESLWGVYRFAAPPPFLTPFGNPNHLAAYALLTGTTALGLAFASSRRSQMAGWLVGFVLMGTAAFLSLSRGGIVFFLFAQAILAAFVISGQQGNRTRKHRALILVCAVMGLLSVAAYLGYEQVAQEISTATSENLEQSKLKTWPMFLRGALHFPVTGMGRGAFEPAFTRFQELFPSFTFTHPENWALQLGAEWGIPGTIGVLFLCLWAAWRTLKASSLGTADAAGVAAVWAVLLHNLFDFNLELPACAVAVCVLLGVLSRKDEESQDDNPPVRGRVGWKSGVALAVGIALSWISAAKGAADLRSAERAIVALYQSNLDGPALEASAQPLILSHPSAAFLYSVVGRAHASRPSGSIPRAMSFINRALFLRPFDAESHRAAARTLLRANRRSQAFLEYRLAYEAGAVRRDVLDEAVPLGRVLEEWTALAPMNAEVLSEVVDRLRNGGREKEAYAVAVWGTENILDETSAVLYLNVAHLLVPKDLAAAWKALERSEALNPNQPTLPLVQADVLRRRGDPERAVKVLESAVHRNPSNMPAWIHLAEHLMLLDKGRAALDALKRAQPFVRSVNERAHLLWWEGNIHRHDGRPANALDAFRSAARLVPERPDFQFTLAEVYLGMGRLEEGKEALRRAEKLEPAPSARAKSLRALFQSAELKASDQGNSNDETP